MTQEEGPEGGWGINPISQPKFCLNPISQPNFWLNPSPRKVNKFSFEIKHRVVLFTEVVALLLSFAVSLWLVYAQLQLYHYASKYK